jgi:hypothetical protein
MRRIKGTLHGRLVYIFFIISRPIILRMKNVSDKSYREARNTQFVFNNFLFFSKSCLLWDNVENYCRAGQTTDDNMAHAHCMLDTQGYKHIHTLGICSTIWFSTATMVARTRLIGTLHVHCLSSWNLNFTPRWIFPRAKSAGLLPIDLATKTNNNYKSSYLWRPMSEKGCSSQGSNIQCRRFDFLISNVLRSFQELRIAVRSVNSDCRHLYTVLDALHPVLQYFDIK